MKAGKYKELFDFLNTTEGALLYARLLKYANRLYLNRVLPAPISAEDIVNTVFEKLFTEIRNFNTERFGAEEALKGMIRSVIRNTITKKGSQYERNFACVDEILIGSDQNEFAEYVDKEQLIELTNSIQEKIKDKPLLEDIFLCILDGIFKPQEIAKMLNIDVKRIYPARQEMKKLLKPVRPLLGEK